MSTKITELPVLSTTAPTDVVAIVDVSDTTEAPTGTTKKVTLSTLLPTGIGGTTGVVDNRVLRADGTGGLTAQGSSVAIDDTGAITGATLIDSTNIVENITTITSSATPTPTGGSLRNFFTVTALAANATFAAPSGTPVNGNVLLIRIKDNGTARTLAFNAIYRAIGLSLPTTTVLSKTMYIGAKYNSADAKWDVLSYSTEA